MSESQHKPAAYTRLTAGTPETSAGILKDIIKDYGQLAVAELLGCDQKTVSRFFNCESSFNPETIGKILELGGAHIEAKPPTDKVLVDKTEYQALVTMSHMATAKLKNALGSDGS